MPYREPVRIKCGYDKCPHPATEIRIFPGTAIPKWICAHHIQQIDQKTAP